MGAPQKCHLSIFSKLPDYPEKEVELFLSIEITALYQTAYKFNIATSYKFIIL